MYRKLGSAIVMVLVLSIVGCGGGGSGKLSQADLVRQADATCKKEKAQLTTAARAYGKQTADPKVAAKVAKLILNRQRRLIAELDSLEAPAEVAKTYDTYLVTLHTENQISQQIVEHLIANGETSPKPGSADARAAQERDDAAHKAVRLAQGIGMRSCGA